MISIQLRTRKKSTKQDKNTNKTRVFHPFHMYKISYYIIIKKIFKGLTKTNPTLLLDMILTFEHNSYT